jgi:lysophospholipase L1-like esterase
MFAHHNTAILRRDVGRNWWLVIVVSLAMLPLQAMAKHEGKLQILLLGDSTCIGSVCRKHDPQGPHLEDVIRLRLAEDKNLPPVNVINQGRDGEFIQRLFASGRYDRDIARLPGIDYVLIRYGLNDNAKREDFSTNFPKDFHELISRLHKDFPSAVIVPMTVIPFSDAKTSERINSLVRRVAEEERLPLLDVYLPYAAELQRVGANAMNYRRYPLEKVPENLREKAHPFVRGNPPKVEVMDGQLDAEFGKLPGWFGDRHPNLAGYRIIGEETAAFLAKRLRDVDSGKPR